MDVLGIDEAGRGPVLGPMVIAGIVIPDEKQNILERMGVKDSKRLTPNRRKILSRKLKNMFCHETVSISAHDIDSLRAKGINLNEIERIAMVKVIENLDFDKAILDSVDIKPERFVSDIKSVVGDKNIIAEHKADDNHVQVAAASILAKVERDEAIEKLNKENRKIGPIGSGYPSDPKTKKFLTNFTYDEMPDFVRKSWATVQKMK